MSPEDAVMPRSLVSIVDDDESVRESLPDIAAAVRFCRQRRSRRPKRSSRRISSARRAVCSSTSRCLACRAPTCNRN